MSGLALLTRLALTALIIAGHPAAASTPVKPPPTGWSAVAGCARQISVAEFDKPLVIGCAAMTTVMGERGYEIYRRQAGQWVRQPRPGYRIADLGASLSPLIVDLKDVLWRGGSRQTKPTECIREVASNSRPDIWVVTCVGKNGETTILRANNLLPAASGKPGDQDVHSWQRMPSGYQARKIAVGDEIWMMNSQGGIFTFDRATADWKQRPGCASDIAANGPHVWVIGCESGGAHGNQIFRWDGKAWGLTAGAAVQISVDPLGNPWVIDDTGGIWTQTFRTP